MDLAERVGAAANLDVDVDVEVGVRICMRVVWQRCDDYGRLCMRIRVGSALCYAW